MTDLYKELTAIGATIDSHESDLYVLSTPETLAIVKASGRWYEPFASEIDGKAWLDVAFAYTPFWEKKAGRQ